VTQTISRRDGVWNTTVVGSVVARDEQPTGSWFAHGRKGRLWLDRLTLRRDDGELTTLNLDQHTRIEVLAPDAPAKK